jgi:hypothetical protein
LIKIDASSALINSLRYMWMTTISRLTSFSMEMTLLFMLEASKRASI